MWTGKNVSLLEASKKRVQNMWIASYQDRIEANLPEEIQEMENSDDDNDDLLGEYMASQTFTHSSLNVMDEYTNYINKERDEEVRSPLEWWKVHKGAYPNLSQMAFDLFVVPAISSECERAFSKASYSITPRRSQLGIDIVEAGETLRSWINAGVISVGVPEDLYQGRRY